MSLETPSLSSDQWRFLAALQACGEPVPLDLAKTLSPVPGRALDEMLTRAGRLDWLHWKDETHLGLAANLPESIRHEINRTNTPDQLSTFLSRLRAKGRSGNLDRRVAIRLLAAAGRPDEAAQLGLDLAHELIKQKDYQQAYQYLGEAVQRQYLNIIGGVEIDERAFVDLVIELSSLSFAVGRRMRVMASYLRTAVDLAESSGNVRSQALAYLHLGRLLAYLDQVDEGLAMLAKGKEKVELLGDTDILKASAEFLGLYFIIRGQITEGLTHLERAEQLFQQEEDRVLLYPMILWALGGALFLSGQVPRALGFYECYWRSSKSMGLPAVASIVRAELGFSLAVARRRDEALLHLQASLQEEFESQFEYNRFVVRAGLAILHYHDGDLKASHEMLRTAIAEGQRASSALIHIKTFLLDLLAAFHHNGFDPVYDGWKYDKVLDTCLQGVSDVTRGVALRRRAEDNLHAGHNAVRIMRDLTSSISRLERSGADLFLIETYVALTRLHLREGDDERARLSALNVWRKMIEMGLEPAHLPPEILDLLTDKTRPTDEDFWRDLTARFQDLLQGLDDAVDEDELFHRFVRRGGRLLNAERGALFRGIDQGKGRPLDLRAGFNITRRQFTSDHFKPSLKWIHRSLGERRFIVEDPKGFQYPTPDQQVRRLLCIPMRLESETMGVLYFDYSYTEPKFGTIRIEWISSLINHANAYIGHILELFSLREETNRLRAGKSMQMERLGRTKILTGAPAMLETLARAERAAGSDATVLVTGETGTGKELLISRLHQLSRRSAGPFIVVDSTTIPENLVESELFGHEKGAFTGADDQKRGRIELAHQGTLFIDEIGELPLQVQVKLLRALETKTFYRVGGTQAVKSDFRLVAATNRSLLDEVAAGRFRQDLYYRLNVIQLVLPPLRERGDDILVLARHFLQHYSEKYGRSGLKIATGYLNGLMAYPWPGNIRQLKNVIERAVVLSEGDNLVLDLPKGGFSEERLYSGAPTMDELQRRYILHTLDQTGGKIAGPDGAAEILGMKRSTLYKRMYKLGIRQTSS
jgi:transcriptional regulator with GAF, ATPase, and Fis domain/tetratricopeptide (TPR) repeat protein